DPPEEGTIKRFTQVGIVVEELLRSAFPDIDVGESQLPTYGAQEGDPLPPRFDEGEGDPRIHDAKRESWNPCPRPDVHGADRTPLGHRPQEEQRVEEQAADHVLGM